MKSSLRTLLSLLPLAMLVDPEESASRILRSGGLNLSKAQKARHRKRKNQRKQVKASRRRNRR